MFERLRNVFSRTSEAGAAPGAATPSQLAHWARAQGWSLGFQGDTARFHLDGTLAGQPWRLESGSPARDYIKGTELRVRARMAVAQDVAVLVVNRLLKEDLEKRVYGAITDSLQTAVDDSLPLEMRWLAVYDELRWPELPASFSRRFAVVGDSTDHAQRWVSAALVSHLLTERVPAERNQAPLLLMLDDGTLSLRMQTAERDLPDLQYAAALWTTAAAVALRNLPRTGDSQPDTLPPG